MLKPTIIALTFLLLSITSYAPSRTKLATQKQSAATATAASRETTRFYLRS